MGLCWPRFQALPTCWVGPGMRLDLCQGIERFEIMKENRNRRHVQGVVTPIGAILKAVTGDTICVRLNLAVTP